MKVSVSFLWEAVGEIDLVDNRLVFPALSQGPGIYRYRFVGGDAGGVYVGEAQQLRRRAYHYANPGPTQTTNLRMNADMREHLAAGGKIAMDVVTDASVEIDGKEAPLNLAEASARRLVENAALRALRTTGGERILNRPGVGEEW